MAGSLPPKYQITRTEEFIRKTQELRKIYERVNELIQSVDWGLSRHPHHFHHFMNDYYFLLSDQLENDKFPKIKVFYKIMEEENIVSGQVNDV